MLRKLAGQTAIYGVSSILVRLLNYLLTPYLTRIMTNSEYGVVTDMYALIPFALVILTMGMESGYFRFAGKTDDPQEKDRVFATTWSAITTGSLLFFAIVLLFRHPIAEVMGYSDNVSFIWIVGAIVALDAITAIPFARLREQGRAKRFVLIRLASVVVNVLLCVFFYSILPLLSDRVGVFSFDPSFGAGYVFVANLVASVVTLLLLLPSSRGGFRGGSKSLLRQISIYSLPLLVSGIAGTANEYIDRQMIKYLMPKDVAMDALGVYGAITKIGVILLLFTQMYRMAAEPFFLSNFKKDEFTKTNAEAMKYFIIISVAIFLGITLFSDLFALIVGPSFREGMYILPVVLLSNILSGVVLNLSFWYKQMSKTKFALLITGTGLVFTIVFNFMLVPEFGYFGAALARLICEMAMVVVSYALNRKYSPTPYDLRSIALYALLGGALYGLGFVTEKLPIVLKFLCNLLLLGAYVLYFIRRENIDLRKVLKKQK